MPPRGPKLELNLTKGRWSPKHVWEIPKAISRAFEAELTPEELGPFRATDHIDNWPLNSDEDLKTFIDAKSKLNEAFAEKLIRFRLPHGVMPSKWEPKKVKILVKGSKVAKYFGEDEVGTRQVEVSLKLFSCGHFYMKQSLPGAGEMPYQIAFEGRWEETDRGVHLDYHLRYTAQMSKKHELELGVEALPEGWVSALSWSGETMQQLNGQVPAIVGGEQYCRVEIVREPDVVGETKARFNESDDDVPPAPADDVEQPAEGATPCDDGLRHRRAPEPRAAPAQGRTTQTSSPNSGAQQTAAPAAPMREAFALEATKGGASGAAGPIGADGAQDDEPMWPLLLGLFVFLLLLAYFCWGHWRERIRSNDDEW